MVTYAANKPDRDILELTDEDAAAMAARVQAVEDEAESSSVVAPAPEPPGAQKDADVHSTPLDQALLIVAEITDVEHLQTIAAREARNPKPKGGRKALLKAVADRLAALTPQE